MLQRIQTIYLLGVSMILVFVSFWSDFFIYRTDEAIYHFNGCGISKFTLDDKVLIHQTAIPLYIITLLFVLFVFFIMFGFKDLNKQLAKSKIFWIAYLITLLGIIVWYYLIAPSQISGNILHQRYSYNFYLYAIGFAFINLAMVNIGKDKSKIDSVNRLR